MIRASMALVILPSYATAQGRGGGMRREGGGGGMQRGGAGYGGMSHSPSFSQPPSNATRPQGSSEYANRPQSGGQNAYAGNRNNSNNPNAGAAVAGAKYSENNKPNSPSNAGAAAAGASYENRNQSGNVSNAGAAAAGADYANRNQSGKYPNAGAAAAGAAYGNRNGYDNGVSAGYWNGNYGNGSMGSYGGMGMASPAYGYGSTPYVNPYVAGMGAMGVGQPGGQGQLPIGPGNNAQASNPVPYDYSQPVNTAAAPADVPPPTDPTTSPSALARQAFQSGDYAGANPLIQQALGQSPNDVGLHQFLALDLFALGKYEQAAAPLYAVLAAGPGWDWTTLIGHYSDADAYTKQLRGLEAFVRANPNSARALFVEAYHYISQGQGSAAIKPLKAVLTIQPNDGVSAQLLDKLQPQSAAVTVASLPIDPARLPGVWVAKAAANATITLTLIDDANFTWTFASTDKPAVTIRGTYSLANGILTLSGKDAPGGPLVGQVVAQDDNHMSFRAVAAPSSDPGLQFAR